MTASSLSVRSVSGSVHLASQTNASITDDPNKETPTKPEDQNKRVAHSDLPPIAYAALKKEIKEVMQQVEEVKQKLIPCLKAIQWSTGDDLGKFPLHDLD